MSLCHSCKSLFMRTENRDYIQHIKKFKQIEQISQMKELLFIQAYEEVIKQIIVYDYCIQYMTWENIASQWFNGILVMRYTAIFYNCVIIELLHLYLVSVKYNFQTWCAPYTCLSNNPLHHIFTTGLWALWNFSLWPPHAAGKLSALCIP